MSLSNLGLTYDGSPVWSGAGEVIYQIGDPASRVGVRFTSGLVDIPELKYRNVLHGSEASAAIDLTVQAAARLPDAWRARVADAHHLLQVARSHFNACEGELAQVGIERLEREPALIRAFYDSWVPKYRSVFTELYEISMAFDHQQIELASHYAERHLYPLLRGCPLHSRSHDKPSGYAGDYQTMLLCSGPDYLAGSLYERFLYWVARNYTMVKTVPARQRFLQDRMAEAAAATPRLKKVVSIACGPAVEIQEFVRTMDRIPIKFVLVDQDEAALAYANDKIAAAILSNPKLGDEVEVECLHLSVRQLMKPDSEELLASIDRLRGASLVYSAGLFDYFPDGVAQKLLMRLYDLLGTDGRLLVGNLRETPDTTWLLDYVLNWPLVYRTRDSMESLASVLKPAPRTLRISFDGTERCLFWDVERPG
jgi:SAM-dependent methyltransferase